MKTKLEELKKLNEELKNSNKQERKYKDSKKEVTTKLVESTKFVYELLYNNLKDSITYESKDPETTFTYYDYNKLENKEHMMMTISSMDATSTSINYKKMPAISREYQEFLPEDVVLFFTESKNILEAKKNKLYFKGYLTEALPQNYLLVSPVVLRGLCEEDGFILEEKEKEEAKEEFDYLGGICSYKYDKYIYSLKAPLTKEKNSVKTRKID